MALTINRIDASEVQGTLDGMLPFEIRRDGATIRARIAGWSRSVTSALPEGVTSMRTTAYEMLARYREDSKRLNRG